MASTGWALLHVYSSFEKNGVIFLVLAGFMSLIAVMVVIVGFIPKTKKVYQNTNLLGYFLSLLIANIIQGIGGAMNLKWVTEGQVTLGQFCTAQGVLKQIGNVANAAWTLAIAIHFFDIIFLRYKISTKLFVVVMIATWSFITFIVVLGPAALHTKAQGPFYGISGSWCWIREEYKDARFWLEYFFQYLSAGVSLVLYGLILLRVRGNLVMVNHRPQLRFVPSVDRWQLAIGRDFIDSSMLRVMQRMIWFPVAYIVLIVPIGIARLSEFAGADVPLWATHVTAFIFNLTGLVNVILFLTTHKLFPETPLPEFNTHRKTLRQSIFTHGVTPFFIEPAPPMPTRPMLEVRSAPPRKSSLADTNAQLTRAPSQSSVSSQTPLNPATRF